MIAVGVERDTAREPVVCVRDDSDQLTRLAVPDLQGPVPARGGDATSPPRPNATLLTSVVSRMTSGSTRHSRAR